MAEPNVSRKLDEFGIAINSLLGKVSNMEAHISDIKSDSKDTRRALYGNGGKDVGMMGRLKTLEDWRENQVWFQRLAISGLVGQGISLIGFVIYALITITR